MEIVGIINPCLVVVGLIVLGAGIRGFKNGMVAQLSSFIGAIAGLATIVLVAITINGYNSHEYSKILVGILCLVIAFIAHRIVDFILTSLKLISKLPVVGTLNRLCGLVMGFAEGIIIFWIVGIVLVAYGGNSISTMILDQIKENYLLDFLFNNNLVALLLSQF